MFGVFLRVTCPSYFLKQNCKGLNSFAMYTWKCQQIANCIAFSMHFPIFSQAPNPEVVTGATRCLKASFCESFFFFFRKLTPHRQQKLQVPKMEFLHASAP